MWPRYAFSVVLSAGLGVGCEMPTASGPTPAFGTPPALFSEGIVVVLQTDPLVGDFDLKFNGQRLHAAAGCRRQGQLPTLDQIIETNGFRAHADPTLVHRQAGSFMTYLIEHEGLERVKAFFRAIYERFRAAFIQSLADAERAWLEVLESW